MQYRHTHPTTFTPNNWVNVSPNEVKIIHFAEALFFNSFEIKVQGKVFKKSTVEFEQLFSEWLFWSKLSE